MYGIKNSSDSLVKRAFIIPNEKVDIDIAALPVAHIFITKGNLIVLALTVSHLSYKTFSASNLGGLGIISSSEGIYGLILPFML